MSVKDEIFILSAKRTPIGNFNGCFSQTKATYLGSQTLASCIHENQVNVEDIGQVYMGCVLSAGLGQAPARQAALGAGISPRVPCVTINKMCGSGMQSIIFAHDSIKAGSTSNVLAGGIENMSQAPYLLNKARAGYRLGHATMHDHMMLDGLEDAYDPGKAMGVFAEKCAIKFNFTREEQDAFAIQSLQRAQQAADNGWFKNEITPIEITTRKKTSMIDADEGAQTKDATKIPRLKPVFSADGTITAANASSISDGAASIHLSNKQFADKHHITPMAKIVAHHTHAQDPEWFTTAPLKAIEGALSKANWKTTDVDLFEINEAFAVVTMASIKELNLDPAKVNIHGGACSLGHPIGASGARIVVTLIHALKQHNLHRGLAALCIGGGEATALAIELIGR